MRISVVGAAIMSDGRCLAAQRSAEMSLPLKWEFPGGKIEPGEAFDEALRRELEEELGVEIEVGEFLARGENDRITLDVYVATIVGGTPESNEHAQIAWLTPDEILELDWAEADIPAARAVADRLRAEGLPA